MSASHWQADNLVAIVDYNKYQESGPVSREMGIEPFADKWQAFGWHVEVVDGHDIGQLLDAFEKCRQVKGEPSLIIAHTIKGKGVSFVEADYTYHGKAIKPDLTEQARGELLCS